MIRSKSIKFLLSQALKPVLENDNSKPNTVFQHPINSLLNQISIKVDETQKLNAKSYQLTALNAQVKVHSHYSLNKLVPVKCSRSKYSSRSSSCRFSSSSSNFNKRLGVFTQPICSNLKRSSKWKDI